METEMLDNQSLPAYVDPFLKLSEEYFSEASHHLVKAALRRYRKTRRHDTL